MHKITFKNWLTYTENAYTAGTAALAFVPSADLRGQMNKTKDMIKPTKAQIVTQLHNIVKQIQSNLPGKIQLFKNNLNNKMVHPVEPFTELLQKTVLQNIQSFSDLDEILEKTQVLVSQIEKTQLEKLDDKNIETIQKLINNIQQIISITEKPETDDEKKKNRDLRVIQMIDNNVVPYVHKVQQVMGYKNEI